MRASLILTLLAVLGGAEVVRAQSLADLAKKEAERRKSIQGTSRVYTNTDLKQVPEPPPDSSAPAPDAGAADATAGQAASGSPDSAATAAGDAASAGGTGASAGAAAKPTEPPTKAEPRDQKYWSNRMRTLREELDRNQTYVAALESRLNALETDFVNRDDPAQRAVIAADRDKARAELARLRKVVADGTRNVADAEEEARRASVPPGWLR